MKIPILIAASVFLAGCGPNCRETVRMGDFEFSQGNYARATSLFAKAWTADSVACPDAREKRGNALRFLGR